MVKINLVRTHRHIATIKPGGEESEQWSPLLSTSHPMSKSSTRSDFYQPLLLLWHQSICLSPSGSLNGFARSARAAHLFVVHISCLNGGDGTVSLLFSHDWLARQPAKGGLTTFLPPVPRALLFLCRFGTVVRIMRHILIMHKQSREKCTKTMHLV